MQEVPATVTIIRREGGVASANCLDQFAELLHCLMALYPGFPDLYDKVVDAIKVCIIIMSHYAKTHLSRSGM